MNERQAPLCNSIDVEPFVCLVERGVSTKRGIGGSHRGSAGGSP